MTLRELLAVIENEVKENPDLLDNEVYAYNLSEDVRTKISSTDTIFKHGDIYIDINHF